MQELPEIRKERLHFFIFLFSIAAVITVSGLKSLVVASGALEVGHIHIKFKLFGLPVTARTGNRAKIALFQDRLEPRFRLVHSG